jgi:putative ABC transport system substrate-binding protein
MHRFLRGCRRVLVLFLSIGLICVVTGAPAAGGECKKIAVAMILFRGETPSEKGFRDTLAASREFDVRFTVFDANQSKERLKDILAGLDARKYDLIYTFGTMATQFALEKVRDVPIIFNVVQRPIEAGVIKSWEHSGNNATGASNIVSMESAFRTLSLVMNIRRFGFIYYDKDPAPLYQKTDIEKVQKKFGFKMIDIPVRSMEAIPDALKRTISAKVDAVIFPSDSFIKANANRIVSVLNQHKIPSIVIIPEMVKENGALLSLGPDYYELGTLAAQNAVEVLKGKKPSDVTTKTVQNLHISINLKTADRMGINFPLQLLSLSTVIR